jgi:hypothetical protein
MCKWQMDDPESQGKFSLSDCTWLEDFSMDLSSRQLKNRGATLFFTFILFPSHLFSFFFPFFLFLIFFSSHYFSFFLFFYFAP